MDEPTFPSDLYTLKSQLQHHGLDPARTLLTVRPRDGDHTLRIEDIEVANVPFGAPVDYTSVQGHNFLVAPRAGIDPDKLWNPKREAVPQK